VRKKKILPDIKQKPEKPLLTMLYAYGSHGMSQTPGFNPTNMVLLNDLEGVLVIVNARGGGEFGDEWRKAAI
jgi:prolyl oligopeptidase PreP (S9A serine peptidase family)